MLKERKCLTQCDEIRKENVKHELHRPITINIPSEPEIIKPPSPFLPPPMPDYYLKNYPPTETEFSYSPKISLASEDEAEEIEAEIPAEEIVKKKSRKQKRAHIDIDSSGDDDDDEDDEIVKIRITSKTREYKILAVTSKRIIKPKSKPP